MFAGTQAVANAIDGAKKNFKMVPHVILMNCCQQWHFY